MRGAASLINDKEFGPNRRRGSVWLGVIGDLVAHARRENEFATIFKLGMEFAFGAKKDVTFFTPMIREVASRVLDETNTYVSKVLSPPISQTTFAFVFSTFNRRPISGAERDAGHLHSESLV